MTHTSSSNVVALKKPDDQRILDGWLTEWYGASVLGHGKPDDTIFRFKRIAEIQPSLRDAAVAMLESIKGIPDERCFVTKTKREFLRKVTS